MPALPFRAAVAMFSAPSAPHGDGSFVAVHAGAAAWLTLFGIVAALIALDLWRHRHDQEPTPRQALGETLFYVAAGVLFGVGVWAVWGGGAAGEFFAGYLVEKSLSVDNVFVWAVIFSSFAIPLRYQHRVLFWGIFGALVLRGVFVAAGTALISAFWWTLPVFGAFLAVSGVKVLRHRDDEGEHGHDRAVRWLGRFVPVSAQFDGHRFFSRVDGRRVATPLLAALVVVELTDVVFAVDSVPAVLAVARDPFLVMASNAFAILGLRALYFLLADARERFHYLAHGLGAVLIFVGVKMMVAHWVHVPTAAGLAVIGVLLAGAVAASLVKERRVSADR